MRPAVARPLSTTIPMASSPRTLTPAARTARARRRTLRADRTSTRRPKTRGGVANERLERAARFVYAAALIADLFLQQRQVDELHVPAAELHPAPTLQIHEHAVHRDARRADECREILLGH